MPSHLHESLVYLFRNRPTLAAALLRDALQVDLPRHTQARIESADLTNIQPTEYRADLVAVLIENAPVLGIIVEVQLSIDERKRYAWPVYVASLRARLQCPVCLLVITLNERVARWAKLPTILGGSNVFEPFVLNRTGVPEISDDTHASADPELAVLSALAHGRHADTHKATQIARAALKASVALDGDRCRLYSDLILTSLSEAARRELKSMDPAKYEYQSDMAKYWDAHGKALGRVEGRIEGAANVILKQLTLRFGMLSEEVQTFVRRADIKLLDAISERVLSAKTLAQALGTQIV